MAPEETDTAMPKISSASGISSTRSSFPVASVHASVPCRLPIPSFVKNWLPKTTSPPPGRAATPSISVHGVVKTCVPAHARGVAAGGGGAGVAVLSGGAGGGVVASGGAGVLSGGAVGVDCGALVEGAVPPVGDAAGVAGAGVVAADETAVPPPPGSLARPHARDTSLGFAPGSLRGARLSPSLCATDRAAAVRTNALPILSNSRTTAEPQATAAPHRGRACRCERHLGW